MVVSEKVSREFRQFLCPCGEKRDFRVTITPGFVTEVTVQERIPGRVIFKYQKRAEFLLANLVLDLSQKVWDLTNRPDALILLSHHAIDLALKEEQDTAAQEALSARQMACFLN